MNVLGRWRRRLAALVGTQQDSEPAPTERSSYAPLFDKGGFDDLVSILDVTSRRGSMVERRLDTILKPALENDGDVKAALLDAVRFLTSEFPQENFAVLWHVVLREAYKKAYTATTSREGLLATEPIEQARQSWASHSGRTFERFIAGIITEQLPAGMRVVRLDNHEGLRSDIESGLGVEDGLEQKYDLGLLGKHDGQWYAFGALHSKTTLRERLNDDDTASKTMMEHGLYSAVVCVSVGTDQSAEKPAPSEFNNTYTGKSNQRKTIEDEGRFNAAFCLNEQTRPTKATEDASGAVHNVDIRNMPNALTMGLRDAWERRLAEQTDALLPVRPPYDG